MVLTISKHDWDFLERKIDTFYEAHRGEINHYDAHAFLKKAFSPDQQLPASLPKEGVTLKSDGTGTVTKPPIPSEVLKLVGGIVALCAKAMKRDVAGALIAAVGLLGASLSIVPTIKLNELQCELLLWLVDTDPQQAMAFAELYQVTSSLQRTEDDVQSALAFLVKEGVVAKSDAGFYLADEVRWQV